MKTMLNKKMEYLKNSVAGTIIKNYTDRISDSFLFNYINEIQDGINSVKAQELIEEQIERYFFYYWVHIADEVFLKTDIKINDIGDIVKEKLLLETKLKIIKYNENGYKKKIYDEWYDLYKEFMQEKELVEVSTEYLGHEKYRKLIKEKESDI